MVVHRRRINFIKTIKKMTASIPLRRDTKIPFPIVNGRSSNQAAPGSLLTKE